MASGLALAEAMATVVTCELPEDDFSVHTYPRPRFASCVRLVSLFPSCPGRDCFLRVWTGFSQNESRRGIGRGWEEEEEMDGVGPGLGVPRHAI
jgi:hypothetical protein